MSNIGWSEHPLTERVPNINDKLDFVLTYPTKRDYSMYVLLTVIWLCTRKAIKQLSNNFF